MLVPENLTSLYMEYSLRYVPFILIPTGRVKFIDPDDKSKISQPTKGTIIFIFVNMLTMAQMIELNKIGVLFSSVL
jgi:hypothetical protein